GGGRHRPRAGGGDQKEQAMADFLYVFRGGMSGTQHFSPEQMQKHMQAWGNWIGELSKRGQFKGGDPLDAGGKQVKGKKKTIVDGPFAQATDLGGGYVLVRAEGLGDAAVLARGCPRLEVDAA